MQQSRPCGVSKQIEGSAMLPRRLVLSMLALPLLQASCSPLVTFAAVAGGDPGARRSAGGIADGPHPRQQLDIYRPSGALDGDGAHVVMFIHGGSWNSGSRLDYGFIGSAMAARGFVTVIVDYRLVPEFHFPPFLDDGALALAWVRDNIASHGGDPARIGLAGHSARACNAVMLALEARYLRGRALIRTLSRLWSASPGLMISIRGTRRRRRLPSTPGPIRRRRSRSTSSVAMRCRC